MIKTVFLDMDGVLVNFRKGIHDAFNKPYDYATLSPRWKFWDDWPNVTFEMVNAACTASFWDNLEWMHDGRDIFNYINKRINPKQIYLLTTPMPHVESPSGKWMWVDAWLPEYVKRTIITQVPKSLFAKPDTLLIDDKSENVDEFRKAGGKAILIARPWNYAHINANKTIYKLRNDWSNNKDEEIKRDMRFRLRYGITLKEYNKLFAEQGGCCAVCKIHQSEIERRFHLDHNHETGKIRGILCEQCNHLLGQAKNDSSILINAAIYLETNCC